jgi:hypothetical protein
MSACVRIPTAAAALALMVGSSTLAAAPPDVSACTTPYVQGQRLRHEAKLLEAREQLLACAQETCPKELRTDCAMWLDEIDGAIPSVVFGARRGGGDVTEVRVLVDGRLVAARLDGRPTPLDPGEHVFTFEAPDAPSVERRAVVREGEKSRVFIVDLTAPSHAAPGASDTSPQAPAAAPQRSPERTGAPVAAYAVGAFGAASLAAFGVIWLTGQARYDRCRDQGCPASTVDSLELEQKVSWVALGVGLVSVGVATLLLLTTPDRSGSAGKPITRSTHLGSSGVAVAF